VRIDSPAVEIHSLSQRVTSSPRILLTQFSLVFLKHSSVVTTAGEPLGTDASGYPTPKVVGSHGQCNPGQWQLHRLARENLGPTLRKNIKASRFLRLRDSLRSRSITGDGMIVLFPRKHLTFYGKHSMHVAYSYPRLWPKWPSSLALLYFSN